MACPSMLTIHELVFFRTKVCLRHLESLRAPEDQEGHKCRFGRRCQYSHEYLWRRRCPFYLKSWTKKATYRYLPTWCPDVELEYQESANGHFTVLKSYENCLRGENCPFAHTSDEILFHPLIYKTMRCPYEIPSDETKVLTPSNGNMGGGGRVGMTQHCNLAQEGGSSWPLTGSEPTACVDYYCPYQHGRRDQFSYVPLKSTVVPFTPNWALDPKTMPHFPGVVPLVYSALPDHYGNLLLEATPEKVSMIDTFERFITILARQAAFPAGGNLIGGEAKRETQQDELCGPGSQGITFDPIVYEEEGLITHAPVRALNVPLDIQHLLMLDRGRCAVIAAHQSNKILDVDQLELCNSPIGRPPPPTSHLGFLSRTALTLIPGVSINCIEFARERVSHRIGCFDPNIIWCYGEAVSGPLKGSKGWLHYSTLHTLPNVLPIMASIAAIAGTPVITSASELTLSMSGSLSLEDEQTASSSSEGFNPFSGVMPPLPLQYPSIPATAGLLPECPQVPSLPKFMLPLLGNIPEEPPPLLYMHEETPLYYPEMMFDMGHAPSR